MPSGDPQGWGSAITYARRYALLALAGVAGEEDDDGAEAGRPAPPAPARVPASTQTQPPAPKPRPGDRLVARLKEFEAELVSVELAQPGELIEHLKEAGEQAKAPPDLLDWQDTWVTFAGDQVRDFVDGALDAVRASQSTARVSQAQLSWMLKQLAEKGRHWRQINKAAMAPQHAEDCTLGQWASACLVIRTLTRIEGQQESKK